MEGNYASDKSAAGQMGKTVESVTAGYCAGDIRS